MNRTTVSNSFWDNTYSDLLLFGFEDMCLSRGEQARQVGEDGFRLLEILLKQQPELVKLETVQTLQKVWLSALHTSAGYCYIYYDWNCGN